MQNEEENNHSGELGEREEETFTEYVTKQLSLEQALLKFQSEQENKRNKTLLNTELRHQRI